MRTSNIHSSRLPYCLGIKTFRKVISAMFFLGLISSAHAQMSGSYTIDPSHAASSTNYQDFRSATTDLDSGKRYDGGTANGPGLSGAVKFEVANGTYNEQVLIPAISGASSTNTVLFEAASGDSTQVILKDKGSNVASINGQYIGYLLLFSKASYTNFSKMTLIREGDNSTLYGGNTVMIESSNNVSVKNCIVYGSPYSNPPNTINVFDDSATSFHNISFVNDHIIYGNYAINIVGSGINCTSILIENSKWDSTVGIDGFISISNLGTIRLDHNVFMNKNMKQISLIAVDSAIVTRNIIYGECVWTNIHSALVFANNEFHASEIITSTSPSFIYFNTFYNPVYIRINNQIVLQNNLFFDSAGTSSSNYFASPGSHSDYNDFVFNTTSYFGSYNNSNYTSLATWQSGTGLDKHSQQYNPYFKSATNLQPTNKALKFGKPIPGINIDMNGNPRDPSHPTVGAYEIPGFDTTICKSSCAYLTAPLTGHKYKWSTGDTTQTIKYCPKASDSLWVTVWTGTGIGDTVRTSNYVGVTSTSCVWPGDANDDGIADMYDVLAIGVAYGDTGAARPSASTGWYAQSCNDWTNSFVGGVNHKNADCNGNGVVDSSDLTVIALNNGKTHLKASASGNPNDPPLSISFSKDSAVAGDTVQAFINLGSASKPMSGIYGIALAMSYENTSPAKYQGLDVSKSWLGTYRKNLVALAINDSADQSVDIGITRTDHNNVSGSGQIAKVTIAMPDNLAGKREVRNYIHFSITSYKAITANEANVPLNPIGDSLRVYEEKSGIAPAGAIQPSYYIYPNPVHDVLHIKCTQPNISRVIVTDVLGKVAYVANTAHQSNIDVPVQSLVNGLYIITLVSPDGNKQSGLIKE